MRQSRRQFLKNSVVGVGFASGLSVLTPKLKKIVSVKAPVSAIQHGVIDLRKGMLKSEVSIRPVNLDRTRIVFTGHTGQDMKSTMVLLKDNRTVAAQRTSAKTTGKVSFIVEDLS